MTTQYEQALNELKDLQRHAVDWQDNPALVLAGPGSGKTRVLTTRIAKLIEESSTKNFRILALTFTNKAADEMTTRVSVLCPDNEERLFIGTFHAFCTHILRQHGSHIGIQSDFTIYALDEDRRQILRDAIKRDPDTKPLGQDETQILRTIDGLMNRFATPETAPKLFRDQDQGRRYARTYALYEEELQRLNALDFNSLLLQTHQLITRYPAIAASYRRTYQYWMIDEFQDTNAAQYRIIKELAGTEFKNVFVVADDDQIIYEWNGASYQQLERFRNDFSPELIQLPTNYRCPPCIVDAANRLVTHNATRTPNKTPLLAGRTITQLPATEHLRVFTYPTDTDEAAGIATTIQHAGKPTWGSTIVLARTRALLEKLLQQLKELTVPAVIAQRRDQFLTAHFQWLQAALHQVTRPLDKRNFRLVVDAYNEMTGAVYTTEDIINEAEQTSVDYLGIWANHLTESTEIAHQTTGAYIAGLRRRPDNHAAFADYFAQQFQKLTTEEGYDDLAEDCAAWNELKTNIAHTIDRNAGLDQFLQQLDLRSKEASPPAGSVRLMTIHGAKGTEADYVYVIGMAEDNIPSFQSIKAGNDSPQMEEERRNCFVAITRTKEQLTLSAALRYRGWAKKPSRFINEMGLTIPT
ncbi:ATP-dependent helicase [uncultured Paludibaculum sp.]|uniref:ATP-dependent helicase n=1 Tax=uncultured Paludibaculum sp. TaxID=1765020 RepID=UPI002AAC0456|nr:ATP-dependent helicase [uncultured Paludibaculum sp.]